MNKVDIIIPSYKPDKRFVKLMQKLERQTYPVNKIIIVNTEEQYYNQLIYGTNFLVNNKNIEVFHISKREFDHGKTRNKAINRSTAEYFVCLTQDAIPVNDFLVEELVHALEQPEVAVAYGRQLPASDCDEIEKFTRNFNYPEESSVKSLEDMAVLGIKTYFCSNVCAIYKRDIFQAIGGFTAHTIFNEDMIYAARAVKAGYRIAYAAKAEVIHSHNYTNKQQFHRNFDLGVSQSDFSEIFLEVPSETEGIKMVKKTALYLRTNGMKKLVFPLYVRSACKFIGYRLGLNYKKLPPKLILKCTMNKAYWRLYNIKKAASKIDTTKGYGRTEAEMKKK